uniref:Uncharacterized protein n=1 Tax=Tanacetum cinerariifolium TaxID=118510 RepID=A0A699GE77_TANCI|nr:hypothetical protein [Tanacetum cinerariifolium]
MRHPLARRRDQRIALHAGQLVIGDQHVELRSQHRQRFLGRGHRPHVVADQADHVVGALADLRFILHQQDVEPTGGAGRHPGRRRHGGRGGCRGRRCDLDRLLLAVAEHVADLARQAFLGIGLADQLHAGIEPAAVDDGVFRVAGREQHGNPGQAFPGLARQFRAAQRAGHHHVGKQQVDRHAAVDHRQRGRGVAGFEHAIAQFGEHVHHGGAHVVVVLGHQDGFAAAHDGLGFQHGVRVFRLARARQVQLDGRALAHLAVDLDVAARLLDQAIHHRQAEAGALAFRLGGKERFERLRQHLCRHAAARVADGNHDVLAGRDVGMALAVRAVEQGIVDFDGEPAGAFHGVARIDGQVQDRVFHLGHVDGSAPQAAGHHGLDFHFGAQRAAQHVFHAVEQAADLDHLGRQRLAPGERQQVAGQAGAALDAGQRIVEPALDVGPVVHQRRDQLQITRDNLQQIIEIVRHAAGQLADGFHFLGLLQRRLGAAHGVGLLQVGRDVAADGVNKTGVGRCRPRQAAVAAVLAAIAVFKAEHVGAATERGHFGQGVGLVVGMDQLHEAGADHVRALPAQDGGERGIDGDQARVEIGHQQHVLGQAPHAVALFGAGGHLLLQGGVHDGQRLGRRFLVVDVGAAADPARQRSFGAADRHRTGQVPAVGAVVAADAELGLVRRAGAHGVGPAAGRRVHVVGMDDAAPAGAIQAARRHPGIFVHAVVEPVERTVGRRGPHMVQRGLGKRAELGFAVAQRPLGGDLGGGFHHQRDHAADLAVVIGGRKIIEVGVQQLGHAGAQQRQFLVHIGQRAALHHHAHHVIVEIGHLGPAFPHLRAQQGGMALPRKHGVGIVVDHVAVLAPQGDDGHGRAQHIAQRGLHARMPGGDGAERRLLPREGVDQSGVDALLGQKGGELHAKGGEMSIRRSL